MIPIPQKTLDKLARHGIDLQESMLPPGAKLKFKFPQPAGPPQQYPKLKFHPTKGELIVHSEAEEREKASGEQGWVNNPAELPQGPITQMTNADKLELLETLGALIGSEAEEGESMTDALYRIIQERNEFAILAAKVDPAKKKGK